MGLVHKILNTKKVDSPKELLKSFYEMKGSDNFPLSLALNSLDTISTNATDKSDYLLCLVEDSIFTSLYVTFYEQILSAVRDNPEIAGKLIQNFKEDRDEREKIISIQTQNHVNFIEQKGVCPGCSSCDNHIDVSELIEYWNNQDTSFFENLYVGMQTIQFSMEHLLYEVIADNPQLTEDLSPANVLKYRQEIFNYTSKYI